MIITKECEIEIDEKKYVPYMKIRKYYAKPPKITQALVIDFQDENVEIQKTKTGTSLFNHKCYCMSEDTINEGIALFDRKEILNLCDSCNRRDLSIWLLVKIYDLEGHKREFIVDPNDKNSRILSILIWLKTEYEEFAELQEFVEDLGVWEEKQNG